MTIARWRDARARWLVSVRRSSPSRSADPPLSRAARAERVAAVVRAARRASAAEWRALRRRDVRDERDRADGSTQLAPAHRARRGAAAERLKRERGRAGLVVTTGQQPGLFGGPLYDAGARRSARARSPTRCRSDRRSRRAGVLGRDGRRRLRRGRRRSSRARRRRARAARSNSARRPVRRWRACRSATTSTQLRECLRDACGVGAARVVPRGGARARIATARRSAARTSRCCAQCSSHSRSPVLDASHPAVARARASAMLRAALRRAPRIERALRRAQRGASRAPASRRRWRGAGLVARVLERRRHKAAAAAGRSGAVRRRRATRVCRRPCCCGPSLERAILPRRRTSPARASSRTSRRSARWPRRSAAAAARRAALVGDARRAARSANCSTQLGVDARRICGSACGRGTPGARAMRAELRRRSRRCGRRSRRRIDALAARDDGAIVPDAVLDGLRRASSIGIERLERRSSPASKRRETDADARQSRRLRGALYPHGVRQERKLNLRAVSRALWVELLSTRCSRRPRAHARSLVRRRRARSRARVDDRASA